MQIRKLTALAAALALGSTLAACSSDAAGSPSADNGSSGGDSLEIGELLDNQPTSIGDYTLITPELAYNESIENDLSFTCNDFGSSDTYFYANEDGFDALHEHVSTLTPGVSQTTEFEACSYVSDLDGLRQPGDIIRISVYYSDEEYGEDELYPDGKPICVVTEEEEPRTGCTLAISHKGKVVIEDFYAGDSDKDAQREFLIDFIWAYANADPDLLG